MEEGLVAVPVVWKYPGKEVYVSGDWNDFAVTELVGEQEKIGILWLRPGAYLYRFLVDGSYTFDPLKDCVKEEDSQWYNRLVVEGLPEALNYLSSMSLEEMEELDKEISTRKSSYSSVDFDIPIICEVPKSTVPEKLGFSKIRGKMKAAMTIFAWWTRKKFQRQRKAAIRLQSEIRKWLKRKRSLKSLKPTIGLQTDLTAKELQSMLISLEQANKDRVLLAQENARLHTELHTRFATS